MDCTIVVATRNRRAILLDSLARLVELPEGCRIVVVDNGSSDGTVAAVRAMFPNVSVLALGGNHGASARNFGVRNATTTYVAFCDDDCWWTPGALPLAVATLATHPRVAIVNARVCVGRDLRTDPACESMARSQLCVRSGAPLAAIASFMAGAIVARRGAFLAAGGYQPRFLIGAEEPLLALDLREAGYDLVYLPESVLVHRPADVARDPAGRRHLVLRNLLWTAWLRYPLAAACTATAAALRAAARDRGSRRALLEALGGMPWILRQRRPVSRTTARAFIELVRRPA